MDETADPGPPHVRPEDMRAGDVDREQVLDRLRIAHAEGRLDLDEFDERITATLAARTYADLMLHELRKVIPSFLKRVDLSDRGVAWSTYLASNRTAMDEIAEQLFPADTPAEAAPVVTLLDFDPDGEIRLVAAMLYQHTHLPERQVEVAVRVSTWRR